MICQSVSSMPVSIVCLFCASLTVSERKHGKTREADRDVVLNDSLCIRASAKHAEMLKKLRVAHGRLLAEVADRCTRRTGWETLSQQQQAGDIHGEALRAWSMLLSAFSSTGLQEDMSQDSGP